MEITPRMREDYATFREADGKDLETLTSQGWHLLACMTRQGAAQAHANCQLPVGSNGYQAQGYVNFPLTEFYTAYLLAKPREDRLVELYKQYSARGDELAKLKCDHDAQYKELGDKTYRVKALEDRLDDLTKWTEERREAHNKMERDIRVARARMGEERWQDLTADK